MDHGVYFLFIGVFEPLEPGRVRFLFYCLGEQGKGFLTISPNGNGGLYILVDFVGVYVEMDDLGLFGVFVETAGDAVVESHTNSDQDVAVVGEEIRTIVAVHTEHADIERVVGGQGAGAEDGPGGGYA